MPFATPQHPKQQLTESQTAEELAASLAAFLMATVGTEQPRTNNTAAMHATHKPLAPLPAAALLPPIAPYNCYAPQPHGAARTTNGNPAYGKPVYGLSDLPARYGSLHPNAFVLSQLRDRQLPVPPRYVERPAHTLLDYIMQLCTTVQCCGNCFVLGGLYIRRFLDRHPRHSVNSLAELKYLSLIGILIAAKYLVDERQPNICYARVGGLSLAHLNTLEQLFLQKLRYSLHVTQQEFSVQLQLQTAALQSGFGELAKREVGPMQQYTAALYCVPVVWTPLSPATRPAAQEPPALRRCLDHQVQQRSPGLDGSHRLLAAPDDAAPYCYSKAPPAGEKGLFFHDDRAALPQAMRASAGVVVSHPIVFHPSAVSLYACTADPVRAGSHYLLRQLPRCKGFAFCDAGLMRGQRAWAEALHPAGCYLSHL